MFSWFTNFIHGVSVVIMLGVLGALVGFGCSIINRIVGGVSGYLMAAGAGAVMMVGAHFGGVLSQMSSDATKAKIEALESANAKLEFELRAAKDIADFAANQAKNQAAHAAEAERQLEAINAVIAKHGQSDCPVGAFKDELDAIRKLK